MTEVDALLCIALGYGCTIVLLAAACVAFIVALAYIVKAGKDCIKRLMNL